jgi:hypothetical protein
MKRFLTLLILGLITIIILLIPRELNSQIALPTFQGVQAISSVTDLAGIFGSATSFTLMGNSSWTNSYACTGWGDIDGNQGFFISYINITTSTATTYQTTQLATNGNGITATSATNASYTPSQAISWDTANNGVWWSGNNASTGILTATMSGGWGTNRGIQIRCWNGGHHKCYLVKVMANSITRFFAPKDIANPSGSSGLNIPNHVFYPLNDTFTSFTDSRLTSLGDNDSVLPDSYFEYTP